MSFPTVNATTGTFGGANTGSHTFTVPAGVTAGEKLLLFIASYDGTGTADFSTPAGWSVGFFGSQSGACLSVFERTSDGTETSVVVTGTRAAIVSYGYILRVSGGADIEYTLKATQPSSASVGFVTAPTITPSWSGDTLYIVAGALARTARVFNTDVTGYTAQSAMSNVDAQNRGVGLIVGHKQAASAAESPGDLEGGTYVDHVAVTMAIKAAPAPVPAVTTTDTLQPGTEFTLTATNYASAPVSPVTLTDTEGSTITVAVTISGSGPYTAVGTMPTIAEAVTAGTSLLFGDVTIELTT